MPQGQKHILMTKVSSSNLHKVGYDNATRTLSIIFSNKKQLTYRYMNVPFNVYQKLLQADSLGEYFHKNIRFQYQYST